MPLVAQTAAERPLSVCELLEHIEQYRGKEVHVRGEFLSGPESVALSGGDCKKPMVTDGHVWLNAVWLAAPGGRLAAEPVDFKLDERSIETTGATIKRERAAGRRGKVFVTVIGKCEARTRYFGGQSNSGNWIGNGFGHLNAYPAQIVYRTVVAPEVFKIP